MSVRVGERNNFLMYFLGQEGEGKSSTLLLPPQHSLGLPLSLDWQPQHWETGGKHAEVRINITSVTWQS